MFNKFEIKFNGESENWYISPDEDCAVYSYTKAQELINKAGKTMPFASELFEVDPETGKSRLSLLKDAGAAFWAWTADKAINPLNAVFVVSGDEYKGQCPKDFVRGIICR